ncbi:MAG TPA: hypothetical protein VFM99_06130, partial [Chitinophagales bacterium]|nr:hypothetical protein [Chitinophagales bacterium]
MGLFLLLPLNKSGLGYKQNLSIFGAIEKINKKIMANLNIKKPLNKLMEEAKEDEKGLKRTLGAGNLIALGIGAIIGAGLFVRTAA